MSRTLRSSRHERLRELLVGKRKAASLSQAELAKRVGRYQSFIADIERGERRVDVVEFLELAEAIGFDAGKAIRLISGPKNQ
jgi:transcriptional regulator with XRE-family HTH domain